MKNIINLIALVVLICSSCKNPENRQSTNIVDFPAGTQLTVPPQYSVTGIDQPTLQNIISNVDQIDYIFNNIPLSMNQDGSQAVLRDISLISSAPVKGIPSYCFPLARKIYFDEGEILIEADLYFSQDCIFQIFIKDEKLLYGNFLTAEGIAFYNNLMNEIENSKPTGAAN